MARYASQPQFPGSPLVLGGKPGLNRFSGLFPMGGQAPPNPLTNLQAPAPAPATAEGIAQAAKMAAAIVNSKQASEPASPMGLRASRLPRIKLPASSPGSGLTRSGVARQTPWVPSATTGEFPYGRALRANNTNTATLESNPSGARALVDYLHAGSPSAPRGQVVDAAYNSTHSPDVPKLQASASDIFRSRFPSSGRPPEMSGLSRSAYYPDYGFVSVGNESHIGINQDARRAHEYEHGLQSLPRYIPHESPREPVSLVSALGANATTEIPPTLSAIPDTAEAYRRTTGQPLHHDVQMTPRVPGREPIVQDAAWMARQGDEHGLYQGRSMTELLATPAGQSYLKRLMTASTPVEKGGSDLKPAFENSEKTGGALWRTAANLGKLVTHMGGEATAGLERTPLLRGEAIKRVGSQLRGVPQDEMLSGAKSFLARRAPAVPLTAMRPPVGEAPTALFRGGRGPNPWTNFPPQGPSLSQVRPTAPAPTLLQRLRGVTPTVPEPQPMPRGGWRFTDGTPYVHGSPMPEIARDYGASAGVGKVVHEYQPSPNQRYYRDFGIEGNSLRPTTGATAQELLRPKGPTTERFGELSPSNRGPGIFNPPRPLSAASGYHPAYETPLHPQFTPAKATYFATPEGLHQIPEGADAQSFFKSLSEPVPGVKFYNNDPIHGKVQIPGPEPQPAHYGGTNPWGPPPSAWSRLHNSVTRTTSNAMRDLASNPLSWLTGGIGAAGGGLVHAVNNAKIPEGEPGAVAAFDHRKLLPEPPHFQESPYARYRHTMAGLGVGAPSVDTISSQGRNYPRDMEHPDWSSRPASQWRSLHENANWDQPPYESGLLRRGLPTEKGGSDLKPAFENYPTEGIMQAQKTAESYKGACKKWPDEALLKAASGALGALFAARKPSGPAHFEELNSKYRRNSGPLNPENAHPGTPPKSDWLGSFGFENDLKLPLFGSKQGNFLPVGGHAMPSVAFPPPQAPMGAQGQPRMPVEPPQLGLQGPPTPPGMETPPLPLAANPRAAGPRPFDPQDMARHNQIHSLFGQQDMADFNDPGGDIDNQLMSMGGKVANLKWGFEISPSQFDTLLPMVTGGAETISDTAGQAINNPDHPWSSGERALIAGLGTTAGMSGGMYLGRRMGGLPGALIGGGLGAVGGGLGGAGLARWIVPPEEKDKDKEKQALFGHGNPSHSSYDFDIKKDTVEHRHIFPPGSVLREMVDAGSLSVSKPKIYPRHPGLLRRGYEHLVLPRDFHDVLDTARTWQPGSAVTAQHSADTDDGAELTEISLEQREKAKKKTKEKQAADPALQTRVTNAQQIADAQAANAAYKNRYWGQTAASVPLGALDAISRAGYAIRGGLTAAGGTALGAGGLAAQGATRAGRALGLNDSGAVNAADAFAKHNWQEAGAGLRDVAGYMSSPNPAGHMNQLAAKNRDSLANSPGMSAAYRGADWVAHGATQALPFYGATTGVARALAAPAASLPPVASRALRMALPSGAVLAAKTIPGLGKQLGGAMVPKVRVARIAGGMKAGFDFGKSAFLGNPIQPVEKEGEHKHRGNWLERHPGLVAGGAIGGIALSRLLMRLGRGAADNAKTDMLGERSRSIEQINKDLGEELKRSRMPLGKAGEAGFNPFTLLSRGAAGLNQGAVETSGEMNAAVGAAAPVVHRARQLGRIVVPLLQASHYARQHPWQVGLGAAGVGAGIGAGLHGLHRYFNPPEKDEEKQGAQDNSQARLSATGESKGLTYQHKPDHYLQGPAAWDSVGAYFRNGDKKKPDPFIGKHAADVPGKFPFGRALGAMRTNTNTLLGTGGEAEQRGTMMLGEHLHGAGPRGAAVRAAMGQGYSERAGAPVLRSMLKSRFPVPVPESTTLGGLGARGSSYVPSEGTARIEPGHGTSLGPDATRLHEYEHALQSGPGMSFAQPRDNFSEQINEDLHEIPPSLSGIVDTAHAFRRATGRPLRHAAQLTPGFPGAEPVTQDSSWMARQGERHGLYNGKSMTELLATPSGQSYLQRLRSASTPPVGLRRSPEEYEKGGSFGKHGVLMAPGAHSIDEETPKRTMEEDPESTMGGSFQWSGMTPAPDTHKLDKAGFLTAKQKRANYLEKRRIENDGKTSGPESEPLMPQFAGSMLPTVKSPPIQRVTTNVVPSCGTKQAMTPVARAFFLRCETLGLKEHQIKQAIDRVGIEYGDDVAEELKCGFEKSAAGNPFWGAAGELGSEALHAAAPAARNMFRRGMGWVGRNVVPAALGGGLGAGAGYAQTGTLEGAAAGGFAGAAALNPLAMRATQGTALKRPGMLGRLANVPLTGIRGGMYATDAGVIGDQTAKAFGYHTNMAPTLGRVGFVAGLAGGGAQSAGAKWAPGLNNAVGDSVGGFASGAAHMGGDIVSWPLHTVIPMNREAYQSFPAFAHAMGKRALGWTAAAGALPLVQRMGTRFRNQQIAHGADRFRDEANKSYPGIFTGDKFTPEGLVKDITQQSLDIAKPQAIALAKEQVPGLARDAAKTIRPQVDAQVRQTANSIAPWLVNEKGEGGFYPGGNAGTGIGAWLKEQGVPDWLKEQGVPDWLHRQGITNAQGGFTPGAAMSGLRHTVEPYANQALTAMGMDPSKMSGLHKLMLFGGGTAALGGLLSGNRGLGLAGGAAAAYGLSPHYMPAVRSAMPSLFGEQGAAEGQAALSPMYRPGQGTPMYGESLLSSNSGQNRPFWEDQNTARNEWNLQRGLTA